MIIEEIEDNIGKGIFGKDIFDDICNNDKLINKTMINIDTSKVIEFFKNNNIYKDEISDKDSSEFFDGKYKVLRFFDRICVYKLGKRVLEVI